MTDAVEKVGDGGVRLLLELLDGQFLSSIDRLSERRLWHSANRGRNLNGTDATSAYARHAACVFGGGRQKAFASVLRFCTIAARWSDCWRAQTRLAKSGVAFGSRFTTVARWRGRKVGMVGTVKFEARIKELVEDLPDLAILVEPLLVVRRVLREQVGILHRRVLAVVRDDEVCRRLMTIPVGPVVALTYRVTVDVAARFRNSKAVGAVFGLTPAKDQSGERDRAGAISRCGDEMMRVMLYEAAQIMLLRSAKWSWLKAWAMKIARHRGMKKAIVALARRLAVIMHRMWVDGTEFRWTTEVAAT